MELLYIWIDDYRNIKKQGFNFSSEYIFDFDEDRSLLDIKKNASYIKNFFIDEKDETKKNIVNVTAIVGKNGSGKTNLLDFLKDIIPSSNGIIESNLIIIFKKTGDEKNTILFYQNIVLKLKGESDVLDNFEKQLLDENRIRKFYDIDVIFYSNIFDCRNEPDWGGLHNISTNFLVRKDRVKRTNEEYSVEKEISSHRSMEIRRNIIFKNSPFAEFIPFAPPKNIVITINNYDERALKSKVNKSYSEPLSLIFKKIQEKESFDLKDKNTKESFIQNFCKALFFNFLGSGTSIN